MSALLYLLLLLLLLMKKIKVTLLVSHECQAISCPLTCKLFVYFVGWIGGWAWSDLLPLRGVGPSSFNKFAAKALIHTHTVHDHTKLTPLLNMTYTVLKLKVH